MSHSIIWNMMQSKCKMRCGGNYISGGHFQVSMENWMKSPKKCRTLQKNLYGKSAILHHPPVATSDMHPFHPKTIYSNFFLYSHPHANSSISNQLLEKKINAKNIPLGQDFLDKKLNFNSLWLIRCEIILRELISYKMLWFFFII